MKRGLDELGQRVAQFADRESHVLARDRLELGRRLLVQRARTFAISALRVQNRDRRLDQALIEQLQIAVGALPDFLPRFVALEESPLIEEVDPVLIKIGTIFQGSMPSRTRCLVLSLLTDL